MILLVDNYDSFTYNLAHLLSEAGGQVHVVRNDAIDTGGVHALRPRGIVISPGPGRPEGAGVSVDLIRAFGATVPILGICLGHQAIGYAYGARVARQEECAHGIATAIHHDATGPFEGLDNPFPAGRYHSLAIDPLSVPGSLRVTARTDDGTIMGVSHVSNPVNGLQFHPESVLTPAGSRIITNWLATL